MCSGADNCYVNVSSRRVSGCSFSKLMSEVLSKHGNKQVVEVLSFEKNCCFAS